MGLLMPIGVLLVTLGIAGSATACYQNSTFDAGQRAEQPSGQTETQLTKDDESESSAVLAPISGLLLATGVVFMGIGIGNWKRPIPSNVRPANPWSDQPGEHGDPPKGLV
jgi:hypothetical protein